MGKDMKALISKAAAVLKEAGAREVYLFGSMATKIMRSGSDIDMAVSGLPSERFFYAMSQAGDILECILDLVDLDEENLFTAYLKKKGKLQRVA